MDDHPVRRLVADHRRGHPVGIYSVCSAHPSVLSAAVRQAVADRSLLLVEATCNQVNQFGGYTGLTPLAFRKQVQQIADDAGFDRARLILGGDHLGPSPWTNEPPADALAKAEDLVAAYVSAGYTKIHLDASMSCQGDPVPLPDATVGQRAARLCRAAESAWQRSGGSGYPPIYVVGSEVPVPGGSRGHEELEVTRAEEVRVTLDNLKAEFAACGISAVWPRVVAVVVQPGVEFGGEGVIPYRREAASGLSRFLEDQPGLVYEAHSTDYQRPAALRAMVEDHFAILKVGPWLTYTYREAVYALAALEADLPSRPGTADSGIRAVLEEVMTEDPRYWRSHYHGEGDALRFQLHFSPSDRVRYYWQRPKVQAELSRLLARLASEPLPETLISRHFPDLREAVTEGVLPPQPVALIEARIRQVLRVYSAACGWAGA